jgi:hypothetical protein
MCIEITHALLACAPSGEPCVCGNPRGTMYLIALAEKEGAAAAAAAAATPETQGTEQGV